jgi:hypothetical protein
MNADPWGDLTGDLAAQLPYLKNGDIVILKREDRYVQLFQGPDGGSIEASANANLPAPQRLSAAGEEKLSEMGWEPPRPPDRHNWWIDYGWPLHSREARRLAELLVATLREAFETKNPRELQREDFNAFE